MAKSRVPATWQTWHRTYRASDCDRSVHGWVGRTKPLVEEGICPEIAVRNELAKDRGWDAVWVRKGFGLGKRRFWREMPPNLSDPNPTCGDVSLPRWPTSVLDRIKPDWRKGGVWDVFAWNSRTRRVRFAEVKGPGDKLTVSQRVFYKLGISAGRRPHEFIVVQWVYGRCKPRC